MNPVLPGVPSGQPGSLNERFGLPTETSGNIYNAKIPQPPSAKDCSQTFNLPTPHVV
jgi:hypothetical protein